MNTLLASILDCISPVAKSASLVTVAVTRVATTKSSPFFLIPNSAPQTFCTSLLDSFHVTFILINSISFFLIENRKCYTFGDHFNVHFVAPEIKRFEIYRFSFGSHLQWKFVRNHIDSCQCCLSRVRNRFNQSLNLCSQDLICTI